MVVTGPRSSSLAEPQRGGFEKTCTYCGAHFHVGVERHSGDNTTQAFACPECGRSYEVRAVLAPLVRLVSPRSDGKDDAYQETMF